MTERICVICGRSFTAHQGTQKVCSEACREEYKRRDARERMRRKKAGIHTETVCPVCGKTFVKKQTAQKYCSHECYKKHEKQRERERERDRAEPLTERQCRVCGKTFMPTNGKHWICSYQCTLINEKARRNGRTIAEQLAIEAAAKPAPKKEKPQRPLSPLAQICAEAREKGLSYGQYVANYITPKVELEKAKKAVKRAILDDDEAAEAKATARARELLHDIEIIGRIRA